MDRCAVPVGGGGRRTRCAVKRCAVECVERCAVPGRGGRTLCAVERCAVECAERCAIPTMLGEVLVVEATLLSALGSVVEW